MKEQLNVGTTAGGDCEVSMTERNYENEYWEAQEHINLLEGERRELREVLFEINADNTMATGYNAELWNINGPLQTTIRALLTEKENDHP